MKRKILYIFTTAVISLAAFSIGKFTEKPAEINEVPLPEIEAFHSSEHGLQVDFTDGTGLWLDNECLAENDIVNLKAVKGWEHWNDGKIAGIELQGDDWTYEITKVPYTVDTTATKTE